MSILDLFETSYNEKLFQLIKTDNLVALEKNLSKNINDKNSCNIVNEFGETMLMVATFYGMFCLSKISMSLLNMLFVRFLGNINIVKVILNHGADTSKIDNQGIHCFFSVIN